jgi:TfoX-like protein
MAYDEELAHRLRELVPEASEKKMFGGLAFMVQGNMAVSASRRGGLLVRIDPASTDEALSHAHVDVPEMGGRMMDGWVMVSPEGIRTKKDLAAWVKRGVAYARSLPPK